MTGSWLEQVDDDHDALLVAIVDALPEPFFVLDRSGRYVAVLGGGNNDGYHDGRSLVGRQLHDVLPAATADRFLSRVHEALDTGRVVSYEYELSSDDVDGVDAREGVSNQLWFDAHISPIHRDAGRDGLVVWMIFDITESKRAMQRLELQQVELERLARTDSLTGLLNRRSFFDETRRELRWVQRAEQPATLILFDLDHFKLVNDSWGHAAGDEARLGGEEFALVVRGSNLTAGLRLAERLRAEIAGLDIVHEGVPIALSASFGVTEIRPSDTDPEDAVRRADAAMYEAKHRGRNQVQANPPG